MAADPARTDVAAEAARADGPPSAPLAHPVEVDALRDAAAAVGGRGRRRRRSAPLGLGVPRRQHGAGQPGDRAELERAGWRTTLEFRENVVRARGGRLQHVIELWRAEAERVGDDGRTIVVAAEAMSAATAWSRLRREADLARLARRSPRPAAGHPTSELTSAGSSPGAASARRAGA